MLLASNQTKARLLASNSTGKVMKAKAVVMAKSKIPIKKTVFPRSEPEAESMIPAIMTKFDNRLDMLTAGTILERNCNQE